MKREELKSIAKSETGKRFIAFAEEVKNEVADIRNKLNVRPEVEKEVRLAIIEILDDLMISRLKVAAEDIEPGNDNYN